MSLTAYTVDCLDVGESLRWHLKVKLLAAAFSSMCLSGIQWSALYEAAWERGEDETQLDGDSALDSAEGVARRVGEARNLRDLKSVSPHVKFDVSCRAPHESATAGASRPF